MLNFKIIYLINIYNSYFFLLGFQIWSEKKSTEKPGNLSLEFWNGKCVGTLKAALGRKINISCSDTN